MGSNPAPDMQGLVGRAARPRAVFWGASGAARRGFRQKVLRKCLFARVVKGVGLRSTGGNSAWVRNPQQTCRAWWAVRCGPARCLGHFRGRAGKIAAKSAAQVSVCPSG